MYIFFWQAQPEWMSCTAISLNFKLHEFPNQARYWAEKLWTYTNLDPLIPGEDKDINLVGL